jgi:hypothetical protein
VSQPDLTSSPRPGFGPKPKSNIYIGLMGVAAMCLAIGCILLIVEINRSANDAGVAAGWFGVITSAPR